VNIPVKIKTFFKGHDLYSGLSLLCCCKKQIFILSKKDLLRWAARKTEYDENKTLFPPVFFHISPAQCWGNGTGERASAIGNLRMANGYSGQAKA
jgi:hypothetical protein